MWKAFRVKQSLENGITEEKNKSGFRKKLISVQLLIALVAVVLFCSGCAGKMNAKKIFRQSSENMQKVTSSANHVELAIQMSDILNLMEVNMEDAIRNLEIPVIFDIYKEELLPAKIVVDMSDVMGDLYKSYGETMKVNLYSIVLQFTDYNKVDEIHVPDEIKNSAK